MKDYRQQIRRNIVARFGEPRTLDELARTVIRTIDRHLADREESQSNRVVGFAWELRYGEVSNSHVAPIGKKTNWSRIGELPSTYPGYQGRVWIRYSDLHRGHGSDTFASTLTYTGTGGWGSYSGPFDRISSRRFHRYGYTHGPETYPEPQVYSWDYRFFEDDWPLIKQARERDQILAYLGGETGVYHTHRFEWQDPEILARDQQFIDMDDRQVIHNHEQERLMEMIG